LAVDTLAGVKSRRRFVSLLAAVSAVETAGLLACTSFGAASMAMVDAGHDSLAPRRDAAKDSGAEAGPTELPGLVGYWPFDEDGGALTADRSGKGNDGLVIGGTWSTGILGGALHSNGDSDRMRVGDLDGAGFPSSGTISLWFNTENVDGDWILDSYDPTRSHIVLSVRRAESTHPIEFLVQMTKGGDAAAAANVFSATTPITLGMWKHVIVVWNTTTAHEAFFYADDKLVAHKILDSSWRPTQQLFSLFQRGCCGGFAGLIDEMRLYDRALGPLEIPSVP
jgi:hypothetical protein